MIKVLLRLLKTLIFHRYKILEIILIFQIKTHWKLLKFQNYKMIKL